MRIYAILAMLLLMGNVAHAEERCWLGVDVPREISIAGIAVVIFVEAQCFGVYENGRLSTRYIGRRLYGGASTGMRGHKTPLTDPKKGPQRVNRASEHHYSNRYQVFIRGRWRPAYMPYALFFDDEGNAVHAGHVLQPNASHGCVRLPETAAQALFYGFPHRSLQIFIVRNKNDLQKF